MSLLTGVMPSKKSLLTIPSIELHRAALTSERSTENLITANKVNLVNGCVYLHREQKADI